jgi:hypothetical protein
MTQMMDCSEARVSLGVYVLGAIDPAERAMVDSHLAGCRDCRDELAGLAGLPALLARVGTAEAMALAASDERPAWENEALAPPDRLVGRVLDLTEARRRRRRWREGILAVAAALVIAAGVFGGLRMTASPAPSSPTASGYPSPGPADGPWQLATGQLHGMVLTVRYRQMSWGTLVNTNVKGIPPGTTCQIWVVGPGNSRMLVGSWTVDWREGNVWYPASAAISAANVQKFVVTVGKTQSITADS